MVKQRFYMRTVKLFMMLIVGIFLVSCASTSNFVNIEDGKQIDKRLVGDWEGVETGQQYANVTKGWDLLRMEDGKYIIDFNANGETFRESGKWWVKDGKYYSQHSSGATEVYEYTVNNNDEIHFKTVKTDMKMAAETYEFIDRRKK